MNANTADQPAPPAAPVVVSGPPILASRESAQERRIIRWSLVLVVLLPTLLAAIYYGLVASPVYVADAGFEVRNATGSAMPVDKLSALAGMSQAAAMDNSDSYIVQKYLKSRDMVLRLQRDIGLKALYSNAKIDPLSRLDRDAPLEDVVRYWQDHIKVSFEITSGVITFRVLAYDPASSKLIADRVLQYSSELVNRISATARTNAVAEAQAEVSKAERQLQVKLAALRTFREDADIVDPALEAAGNVQTVTALGKQLADIRARQAALAGVVDVDAPTMKMLADQQRAVLREIDGLRGSGSGGRPMSSILARYESLQIEKAAAQQTYASALGVLEKAKVDAVREQRYFAVYSSPSLPERALYPRRLLSIALVFVACFCLWGIAVLIGYSVRDHLA